MDVFEDSPEEVQSEEQPNNTRTLPPEDEEEEEFCLVCESKFECVYCIKNEAPFRFAESLKSIEFTPKEYVLDIGACAIADALRHSKTLKTLKLESQGISSQGVERLSNAMIENKSLTELDLKKNFRVDDDGVFYLCYVIGKTDILTHLNLSWTNISPKGACAIANLLKTNTSLCHLDLAGVKLKNKGAIAIANSLAGQAYLKFLNLKCTKITEIGACSIADALQTNNSLITLFIDGNNLGDDGAMCLGDTLSVNNTLRELDISKTRMSEIGGKLILEGLKNNVSITKINISCKYFPLTLLNFWCNNIYISVTLMDFRDGGKMNKKKRIW